ncbi:SCAN domain-containing protein 3 [Eumeta japonica]|uniref:SCAN domain-containing protein 3 n=1 Tax=Eumeta variegata TaxID=151549 RepID=A0A4C1U7J8_EUMVA|nr:SCAN domain-containing protein 3 [Eumeta japonica]
MKPSRLQDHFNKMHPDKKDKNVAYFQDLEKKHNPQPSVSKLFSVAAKQDDDGLRASYNISLLIVSYIDLSHRSALAIKRKLTRFYNLFNSLIEFLENKDTELRKNLITSKNDIAYLTDLYTLLNNMNLQLQGDDLNLIKAQKCRRCFRSQAALTQKEYRQTDFVERFQDILKLEIPDWVLDPFSNVNIAISPQLEEELIELTTNEEIKIKYKNGYQQFWLQKSIPQLYPGLWSIVERFLIAFPSSYLCERGFSAVTTLLTKKRSYLQVTKRGDLRLILSKIEPDINKLIKYHQIHPSH